MALRRPVFAPSVLTLQAVTVVFWEVKRFATFTLGYNHAPPTSKYYCWTTSAIWTGSHFSPVGSWMDISTDCCICWAQYIGGVSLFSAMVCGKFPRPQTRFWTLRSSYSRQDRLNVRAVVATRTAYRDGIRPHFAPAVSPRTIWNRLVEAGLRSRVPVARLPLTPRHRQARLLGCREGLDWRVEWRSVVFSDERSFWLYASDGRTRIRRSVDLVGITFRGAFAHETQAPPHSSRCEDHQLQLAVKFGFSAG